MQNVQNNNQATYYDGSGLMKYYDYSQWNAREDWYTASIQNITIPNFPDTKDIQRITSQIDFVLSQALIDCSNIQNQRDKWKLNKDLMEKEAYSIQKQIAIAPPANGVAAPQKVTEKEILSLVTIYLKNTIVEMNCNIYTLYQEFEKRYTFIHSVVTVLKEKKQALVADIASIKLEMSLDGNVTANIQSNNGQNVRNNGTKR